MAVIQTRKVCLTELKGCQFGFYTPEQIRKLSVKHITVPSSFDTTGQVVDGGPYDRALGPIERAASCATCGLDENGCLGHFGHIQLPLPVYNAFFIDFLLKALKATCLFCYRLRLPRETVRLHLLDGCKFGVKLEAYVAQLVLLRKQEMSKALSIHPSKSSLKSADASPNFAQKKLVREALELLKGDAMRKIKNTTMTSSALEFFYSVHKEFLALLIKPGRCASCGCTSPAWRKEGASKVTVQPLSQKAIAFNATSGCIPCNPLTGEPLGQRGEPDVLTPMEAMQILKKLWEKEHWAMDQLGGGFGGGKEGYKAFFYEVIPVLPNKYRPCTYKDGTRTNHYQTLQFIRILNIVLDIRSLTTEQQQTAGSSSQPLGSEALRVNTLNKWNELQLAVNQVVDSTFSNKNDSIGVRQFLEKKEGVFRKYMMGKRVNFAARSTISPDVNLGVGEVGIPPDFAKTLSFPEKVTEYNRDEMKKLIIRGAHQHPGAVAVEDNKGTLIDLAYLTEERRMALARRLYVGQQGSSVDDLTRRSMNTSAISTVFRHLRDGDMLLTNRQPTLHKASLMAHKARVLKGERTIRFHYANCAAFNADFDGDEMNLHFPQDHLCRAEGYEIIHADHQYINPTDGAPLRGLIQDSIDSGVLMSMKDTFFKREDYMHLLFIALSDAAPGEKLGGGSSEEETTSRDADIFMQIPAIMKPNKLWTGKQVISSVLANLSKGRPQVTTAKKCKTPFEFWGCEEEGVAMVRQGHLLTGVLDKSQYQSYGLVHACQELYGDEFAGKLLSSLSRLFVRFLQIKGFTCGIGDAFLDKKTEKKRKKLIKTAEWKAIQASAKMIGMDIDPEAEKRPRLLKKEVQRLTDKLSELYRADPETAVVHDSNVKGPMHQLSSEVTKLCLPDGIAKPFRHNGLTVMTSTGAKGSLVNFSQISCLLGQQELEGRRVPRMMSGKTLPCFAPYDPGARSGGFISDRFLTGLRPPEYYFHCMAGREGLVDTSVKTASSGYLQRCLVKNMEALRIQYDSTVRDDTDGTVYQFYYGEDGLDVVSAPYLDQFKFVAENAKGYKQKLQLRSGLKFSREENLRDEEKEVKKLTRKREKFWRKGGTKEQFKAMLPIMSLHRPSLLGSMSERMIELLWDYSEHNPNWLLHESDPAKLSPKELQQIVKLKYMESLAAPGEAVGILAAQSVGEPSTQMTLNTFHMAGRGEANVTLGIPRLREILMTASTNIKTPVMVLPLRVGFPEESAHQLANKLRRIRLGECFKDLWVQEWPAAKVPELPEGWGRRYNINMEFHPPQAYPEEIGLTWMELETSFRTEFITRFKTAMKQELNRINKTERDSVKVSRRVVEADESKGQLSEEAEAEETEDDSEEAKRQYRGGRGEQAYDAPDVDDREDLKAAALLEEADEEEIADDELTPSKPHPDAEPESEAAGASSSQGAASRLTEEFVSDPASLRCTLQLAYPFTTPKVSMLSIAERVAAMTHVRSKAGIQNCYVVKGREGEQFTVQTDGVSFETAWEFADTVEVDEIRSNDIAAVLKTYGVEAARSTIIQECTGVFGAYGISVDPRHLGLIADYMTNLGGYRGCNYRGIAYNPSPFLKMSFERSTQFLKEAALHGAYDPLNSPAARIVVGRPPLVGTGCMEIIHRLPDFE